MRHAKVKAHTALYRIEEASAEDTPRLLANRAVDLVARKTANDEWGFLRYADLTKRQKSDAVKGFLGHVAAMGSASARLTSDTTPYEPVRKPPAAPKASRQEHVARLTEVGYGYPVQYAQCVRCWKAFRGPQAHAELMRTACAGHVAQRIVRPNQLSWFITVKGHHLWRSGPYVWCARCGCHSSQRAVGLKEDCKPRSARASRELGNLRAGRKPRGLASEGRQYWPERLTVAGWLEFTGAPLEPGATAVGIDAEELEEQQTQEQWQMGLVQGSID